LKKLTLPILAPLFFLFAQFATADVSTNHNKKYKEMEFIQLFKGKPQQFVLEKLGKPIKKQNPVMPSNAESYVGKSVPSGKTQAGVKSNTIEMWYYANLVFYNENNTFKKTELTFIDGICTNLTFVN